MTFRAVALGNDELAANVGTAAVTVPATVQPGDVLIVVSCQNTGADTHTVSGGGVTWTTRQGPNYNGTGMGSYLWTATAVAGTAGSTVTVTSVGGGRLIALLYAESAATEAGILTALTIDTVADTAIAWPSVTTPADGWSVIGINTMRAAATTAPTVATPPAGTTVDGSVNTAFGTSPNYTITALHVTTPPAAGSRSPGSATASAAVTSNLYTIALAPAPVGSDAEFWLDSGGTWRSLTEKFLTAGGAWA